VPNTPTDTEVTTVSTIEKQSFRERAEIFIDKYTPNFVKRWCNKILDILPNRTANWIREHRFLTICIFYTIKGLFFRPSMWVLYAAIFAYFKA
jgi:hypothetical protein